ncbi:prepilin peptidase [Pseudoalteromonas aurantia]|uniref:Prepilin leader peptidase/N-methyltransferase n=1 Tax=Pseudoalteromonas aurantia TaxID=43654 RepID=A0A5S3VCE7_9GAMM|nr:A24 family peptidase [Pseudoalteromonas aurantia]TMO69779.1 prepilin peptidase [Pseudoalteromonas aurantia]TMO77942.1 prepilin peptidase [Pseudoalteromonas aurantia]
MQDVIQLLQTETWFFLLTVGLVSLCMGSFLNVVIYRLPIMMNNTWQSECRLLLTDELPKSQLENTETFNLSTPHSSCPKCGHAIKAWQNIPLVSWLLLKGRCFNCKTPISVRYPLIELGTALVSLWLAQHFGPVPLTVLYLIITWALIALIFIDIDHMLLPDQITLPLLWLALLTSCFDVTQPPSEAIIGAAVGYLSLWSVYWLFKLTTGKEGMGFGDFKLLAIFGALLGWQAILTIVLLSSFVGAIIGSVQLAIQGKDKSTPIPFGPYLAIAGWLCILYGEQIHTWYFNLLGY